MLHTQCCKIATNQEQEWNVATNQVRSQLQEKWCGGLYIKTILSMIHKEKFKSVIATQL